MEELCSPTALQQCWLLEGSRGLLVFLTDPWEFHVSFRGVSAPAQSVKSQDFPMFAAEAELAAPQSGMSV